MDAHSFRSWLIAEIREVLDRESSVPPLLLWLDPGRQWLDLLRAAAEADGFELWANPDEHELVTRDRFRQTEHAARVVWLPVAREGITWFKPFELEAEAVWEKSLLEALREYGVYIPREHETDLISLLPAHAREWFDKPRETWRELTPANAKGALVDDHRMLQVLAGPAGEFDILREQERFDIFARRATEDFGLPSPQSQDEQAWRVAATGTLLCTEAADATPNEPPSEGEKIVSVGLARKRSLDLLKAWQNHVKFIPTFERLVCAADGTIGLSYWVRNLTAPPRSRSSCLVEKTLFGQMVDQLDRLEAVDLLADELERNVQTYKYRDTGFWGRQATEPVGWRYLVQLAEVASLIVENRDVEEKWTSAREAVEWYTRCGWQFDQAGEQLFKEETKLPDNLLRIRARLRRSYLRAMDRVSRTFSELLSKDDPYVFGLPSAGEVAHEELQRQEMPTALVFLDACRLDLGQRLAKMLNQGEPAQRATVTIAVAPVPTVTELGMAFALPEGRDKLRVELSEERRSFKISAEGVDTDLAKVEGRSKWLKERLGIKEFLTIDQVLDGETLKKASRTRRLIAVRGREFDRHDGTLQLTGAEEYLDRYVQAIRRLRDFGYHRVIVMTDHGFFHWEPEEHEIEERPEGTIMWASRRAIVGSGLSHPHAIRFGVSQGDSEVMVPRGMGSFRTPGRLEFFHGGTTLQELIIPTVIATWPAKARKVNVVLKPVGHIASLVPRVQIQAGATGQKVFFGDSNLLSRHALVKVKEPTSGKVVFKHSDPVTVEPDGDVVTIQLSMVEPPPDLAYNSPLEVLVIDADNEEILAREDITLKVEINDW